MYRYALKLTKLPKSVKKNALKKKNIEMCKLRVPPLKYGLHKTNYVFGNHCI